MSSVEAGMGAGTAVARGAASPRAPRTSGSEARRASWLPTALRVPLLGKLLGTNVLVALVGMAAVLLVHREGGGSAWLPAVALASLLASVAVSAVLTRIALQPLARLRETLRRVSRGEALVRVRPSSVADRDLLAVGDAVNDLLDDLVTERSRLRQLARATISHADRERARIARGLHDSTAQTLAALSLEARTALHLESGRELDDQLELIKDLAIDALEEVRDLSHTIYPRVLDDLGLAAALGSLARCARESSGLATTLDLQGDTSRLPPDVACTLFRIAEAVIESAAEHADAERAHLRLSVSVEGVDLEASHDGIASRTCDRLDALGERLALSSGSLTRLPGDGRGVHVHAFIPLATELS